MVRGIEPVSPGLSNNTQSPTRHKRLTQRILHFNFQQVQTSSTRRFPCPFPYRRPPRNESVVPLEETESCNMTKMLTTTHLYGYNITLESPIKIDSFLDCYSTLCDLIQIIENYCDLNWEQE